MAAINVGLIGTGYAAQRRAEAVTKDERSHLLAISGTQPERVKALCQTYGVDAIQSYKDLINDPALDLIVISTMNYLHGAIVAAALNANKHVVVEYPLALDIEEAEHLIQIAQAKQKLLHVEHIELLSGIHQAVVEALPKIGQPFYVQSVSLRAEQSIPNKWSYHPMLVGFPLMGALSRIQRLVTVFGEVETVSCQSRFWSVDGIIYELPDYGTPHSETPDDEISKNITPYRSCLCSAQLRFVSGVIADVVYGKGTDIWKTERSLDIHGEVGMLHLHGNQGRLVQRDGVTELTIGSRRGLFAKDTHMVLDALLHGDPLYVTSDQSVYALKVADAARRSALGQGVVRMNQAC